MSETFTKPIVREPGLSEAENQLLNSPLANNLDILQTQQLWNQYQSVIGRLLIRMGQENPLLSSLARTGFVSTLDGVKTRIALIPRFGYSTIRAVSKHGLSFSDLLCRLAGECSLMEYSAAAGYRTFCLPALIQGLQKTGKMQMRPVQRMLDTFDFLNTMCQHPLNDPQVKAQICQTNNLHRDNRVAGSINQEAKDLFKYIALDMFYVGPAMRPDITPHERHALCGLTVLVSEQMGHVLEGSVKDFDAFIAQYEATHFFDSESDSNLRLAAIAIAQASQQALYQIPTISPARIHSMVPYPVKKILQID